MHWNELEERQPRLAATVRERLIDPGVLLVVSLRADGTARLSPVEPYLLEGRLLLSMLWQSRKARDLQRDPRILVHGIVTRPQGDEGELKLRGRAVEVGDRELQARYAAAVSADLGWRPEVGWFHLFEVDVEHVAFIRYVHETGDQFVTTWPPGSEFVRRGATATSLGDPEPVRELLVDGDPL
jgi:hypothetical protein